MVTSIARPNTLARWQAALKRAHVEGVQVRQLAGSGAWIATSSRDASIAYEVSIADCDCHAAQHGDPICKHRAMLRWTLNLLPFPTPAAGLAPERIVAMKADAAKAWAAGGDLVNPFTGEIIERRAAR